MILLAVKPLRVFAFLLFSIMSCNAGAQAALAVDEASSPYLARIELHTADELFAVLQRSHQLFQNKSFSLQSPVAFVLHGAEARVFFREAYRDNQALVDLAAKLSALKVVDIRVCRTWMGTEMLDEAQLQPFVGAVPFGLAEEKQLIQKQGYRYF